MTSVEFLIDWMGKNHYFIGNDLLQTVEQAKEMEKQEKHAEYMRGWKDGYSKNETFKNTEK